QAFSGISRTSGISDDSTADNGPGGVVEAHTISSTSSEFEFSFVPGLASDGSDERSVGSKGEVLNVQESTEQAYNSTEAHMNGTCKPCRFFQLKEGGCRLGESCKFCHLCSRDEARAERLRIKYEDRRAKRRQGVRRR
ncbi:unnamed protein product, partial [Effrenium voratum]